MPALPLLRFLCKDRGTERGTVFYFGTLHGFKFRMWRRIWS
jgi:hypothetical protein